VAQRGQAYASNSHIFLMWMVGTSVVLLTVAILFLRNQIRPILRLAEAADAFGKGRPVPNDFRPRGAREVRQASQAFLEMRDRIRHHVEQRTTMLAGVSHDLRTVLTRFKLELALLGDTREMQALKTDVNEMQHMLEDYMAFAKGDGGEEAESTDVGELLGEVQEDTEHLGTPIEVRMREPKRELVLPLKRQAFKRAVTNLVTNAARFGDCVIIRAAADNAWLRIEVDDDGPGVPPAERDNVFRPFYRLDHARNQHAGNSGLGLAIARDIARSHGGDIALGVSSMGGLRATMRVPL
jgi:two-component system osmolarity sensor histidine kinase EnvZ